MLREVKLISAVMFKQGFDVSPVEEELIKKFGEIDLRSDVFNFNHTDYYEKEMGRNLKKYFISFKKLFLIENIYNIKINTISIENKFLRENLRSVNLDPGYIELSKMVLFSTKNYSHRIYLGKNIFAEITLIFRNNRFSTLPWTYPDYRQNLAIEFFNKVREVYKRQLKGI